MENSTALSQVCHGFGASKHGRLRQFERSQPLNGQSLGSKMDLGLACTQLLHAAIEIAVGLSHQSTRWSTSKSGAGCAARLQSGAPFTPSSTSA